VRVKDLSTEAVQEEIQRRLADGYMKYPVVSVSLRESRSRKFFVYGEVVRPGAYAMDEQATVLKAISIAGGFTQFGSSSRVKVLRAKVGQPGYENLAVNMKAVMDGNAQQDLVLRPGDIIVVSEGVF
jgi:polysaccharide export outer membrane protein